MKYSKQPISFEAQLQKLMERGLSISDSSKALSYLSNISYYRLRAYTYPFQDNDDPKHPFIQEISMEEIMEIYTFDRKLRLLVFDAIEKIEIALRTQIIYQWAISHGSHWHTKAALYRNDFYFGQNITSLHKEIERSHETFIKHYQEKYDDPLTPPAWMALEVSSFGLLSLMFFNLKRSPEKKQVVRHFGLYDVELLENWMRSFTDIRNICAHHGRLWNRRLTTQINLPKKTEIPFIENKDVYPNKLYPALCAMAYLLDMINEESLFKNRLVKLFGTVSPELMGDMGFPEDWQDEKFWQI
ncbi:Abi family protein [Shivajiella indica]|uniref:Abi family protein n=1 Tax=Shivajiella indica TaxID=872115 RepID=A0ABW5BD26_9BACT